MEGRKENDFICSNKARTKLVVKKYKNNLILNTDSSKASGFGHT